MQSIRVWFYAHRTLSGWLVGAVATVLLAWVSLMLIPADSPIGVVGWGVALFVGILTGVAVAGGLGDHSGPSDEQMMADLRRIGQRRLVAYDSSEITTNDVMEGER